MFAQQPYGEYEQVVEGEGVAAFELLVDCVPHRGHDVRRGVAAGGGVAVGREQTALGERELGLELGRGWLSARGDRLLDRASAVVDEQRVDDAPDVGLVVDGVGVGAPEE